MEASASEYEAERMEGNEPHNHESQGSDKQGPMEENASQHVARETQNQQKTGPSKQKHMEESV